MIALLAALMLQGPARIDPDLRGIASVRDSLEAAELRFFFQWRETAKQSSDALTTHGSVAKQTPAQRAASAIRSGYITCAPDANTVYMTLVPRDRAIHGTGTLSWACPSWPLSDSLPYADSRTPDGAIDAKFLPAVRSMRSAVIARFDRAARGFPDDAWIAGQRVRLLIDQADYERALAAARACRANAVWCGKLVAYALAMRGAAFAADSAFTSVARLMPPVERCVWSSLSAVLDSAAKLAYDRLSCAERDSANRVFWWLADPLYLDPGNERRVEHFTRVVFLELRSALDRDEHHDWRPEMGADAVRQMLVRYGQPSYMWPLWFFDINASGCPAYHCDAALTTYEYTRSRLQTFPAWSAVADPAHATAADWSIGEQRLPPLKVENTGSSFITRATIEAVQRISSWWPYQHFAPSHPLVQLGEGQTAFLRRESRVVFASAVELDSAAARPPGSRVDASLIASFAPDSASVVAHANGIVGNTLSLFGEIESRSGIGAIEYPAGGGPDAPGGRTRFGIAPPPTLAAVAPGETAISDIVLLHAPSGKDLLPSDMAAALSRMSGSAHTDRGSRIGLYWETYGILPTDTVEIAVWIERHTPQGILRRFGTALNIATDLNTPVVQSWTETAAGPGAVVIKGRVPIICRSVVLDASKLRPGAYWLDVVVRKKGGEPARSRRAFTVVE